MTMWNKFKTKLRLWWNGRCPGCYINDGVIMALDSRGKCIRCTDGNGNSKQDPGEVSPIVTWLENARTNDDKPGPTPRPRNKQGY